MTTLRVLVLDPRARVGSVPDTTWYVSGILGDEPAEFVGDGTAEADLCRRIGDAAVIRIDHPGSNARRLRLWKGATSSYEPFYSVRPTGDVVVADQFRNVLAMLPVDERRTDDEIFTDHLLFRHRRGTNSYVSTVQRPGHGEVVDIDLATGGVETTLFDRADRGTDRQPVSAYTDRLDDALSTVTKQIREIPGVANMLSGGADSTVVQSFLGTDVPAVNVSWNSDALHFGDAHLDAAAAALGIEPERIVIDPDDFLEQVEEAVDDRGLPPHFPQWSTLSRIFPVSQHSTFVIGERAGRFARPGGPISHQAQRFQHFPGSLARPFMRLGTRLTGSVRLDLLSREAADLNRDPFSTAGFASQVSVWADRPLVEKVVGADLVDDRLQARIDYIGARVDLLPPDADLYIRHVELAAWMMFYNEVVTQFRQIALAHGKSVIDPFIIQPVTSVINSIPPIDRFFRGAHSKYLIAELVQRRVPDYPKGAPKDEIAMPFKEQYTNGPLGKVWDRYDVPDAFTGAARERMLTKPSQTTWTAMTWAIWKARVIENSDLTIIGEPIDQQWSIGSPTAG